MKVELLHHTPMYHKLPELVSRVCYDSFGKVDDKSHNMLKGIMAKGHLSVASVGNIVFGINVHDQYEPNRIHSELSVLKEINNYIRWTGHSGKNENTNYDFVVSMNILTALGIEKEVNDYYPVNAGDLWYKMRELMKGVPCLWWFFDPATPLEDADNPYLASPDWGNPVILSSDYEALRPLLTDYEMDVHCTVAVDFVTDRMSGQMTWRHSDMASTVEVDVLREVQIADMLGGCEVSQRYVDRSNAGYRLPVGLDDDDNVVQSYMDYHLDNYSYVMQWAEGQGIHPHRAKEIARNLLPNVQTRIMQCRPLRQWKHFFNLRCTPHAQAEMRADATAIRNAFIESGIALPDMQ